MFDVIIIGGGISGLSAAIYTAYGKLSTLVIDTESSQVKKVGTLKNYPGIIETSGDALLDTLRVQAETFGSKRTLEEVSTIEKNEDVFEVKTDEGNSYTSKYVIVATNLKTSILEEMGFELEVNKKVPSGKIKQVVGVGFDGATTKENLFIAGLLTGISSQSVIAAGQGAQLGVDIVTKETGKTYIWHDV